MGSSPPPHLCFFLLQGVVQESHGLSWGSGGKGRQHHYNVAIFPSRISSLEEARPKGSNGLVKEFCGADSKRFSDDGERKMRENQC